MSSADRRRKRERTQRMIVQAKGAAPLRKREIDYLFRNDRAKEARGFVEEPASFHDLPHEAKR